jgi:HSP20 family protein
MQFILDRQKPKFMGIDLDKAVKEMKEDMSRDIWKRMQNQAGSMLGDQFWKNIGNMIPQRFPRMDLYEMGNELILEIELPGLASKKDVKVRVNHNSIDLQGEIHREISLPDDQIIQQERTIGSFDRQIELPFSVNPQQVKARFRNGLLEIKMRKQSIEEETPVHVDFEEES